LRAGSIDGVDTLSAALGETIRRHRVVLKLSQEQLAERAGLHRTHISYLERGLRSPTVAVLARIAEALGVRTWQLLREAEEERRL
jgi:transcriptional regulator with XRE-family HTH domain